MDLIPNPLIIPIGMVIGVLVAAPVGPVNILCIQRAIAQGMIGGVIAGLGAVLGDGLIALSAALSFGAIAEGIEHNRMVIQMIGGLVLFAFGWHLYRSPPPTNVANTQLNENGGTRLHLWDIPKSFLLTVTNPGAVLGLFAIYGGISTYVGIETFVERLLLVAAIMAGSLCWWFGLSSFIARVRHGLSERRLTQINILAGLALVAFGVLLLGELAFQEIMKLA